MKKTAVIMEVMEVKWVAKIPNVPQSWIVIGLIMRNSMKKVIVVCQRTSLKNDSMSKLTGIFHNQTSKTLILKVLFIIKDLISGNYLKELTKVEVYLKIQFYEDKNPEFTMELKRWLGLNFAALQKLCGKNTKRKSERNS